MLFLGLTAWLPRRRTPSVRAAMELQADDGSLAIPRRQPAHRHHASTATGRAVVTTASAQTPVGSVIQVVAERGVIFKVEEGFAADVVSRPAAHRPGRWFRSMPGFQFHQAVAIAIVGVETG